MKYSLYNNNNLCILHGQVFVMCGKKLRRSIIPWHQENMSVKCVPLQTPHLYSKTGVCKGIPIFLIFAPKHRLWVLGEAVLSCTHNLCFEQKQEKIYKKSTLNFQILQFQKNLYITWACFRNGRETTIHFRMSCPGLEPKTEEVTSECIKHYAIKAPKSPNNLDIRAFKKKKKKKKIKKFHAVHIISSDDTWSNVTFCRI